MRAPMGTLSGSAALPEGSGSWSGADTAAAIREPWVWRGASDVPDGRWFRRTLWEPVVRLSAAVSFTTCDCNE